MRACSLLAASLLSLTSPVLAATFHLDTDENVARNDSAIPRKVSVTAHWAPSEGESTQVRSWRVAFGDGTSVEESSPVAKKIYTYEHTYGEAGPKFLSLMPDCDANQYVVDSCRTVVGSVKTLNPGLRIGNVTVAPGSEIEVVAGDRLDLTLGTYPPGTQPVALLLDTKGFRFSPDRMTSSISLDTPGRYEFRWSDEGRVRWTQDEVIVLPDATYTLTALMPRGVAASIREDGEEGGGLVFQGGPDPVEALPTSYEPPVRETRRMPDSNYEYVPRVAPEFSSIVIHEQPVIVEETAPIYVRGNRDRDRHGRVIVDRRELFDNYKHPNLYEGYRRENSTRYTVPEWSYDYRRVKPVVTPCPPTVIVVNPTPCPAPVRKPSLTHDLVVGRKH